MITNSTIYQIAAHHKKTSPIQPKPYKKTTTKITTTQNTKTQKTNKKTPNTTPNKPNTTLNLKITKSKHTKHHKKDRHNT